MPGVLIIDDKIGFRQVLRTTLQKWFPALEVREASDGLEALQQIDILTPDLVFMDISLPRGSGLELTTKIKGDHPDVAVTILTNHDLPEYREAALQCGADYFVAKDAPLDQILEVVESLVREPYGG